MTSTTLQNITNKFNSFTQKPVNYLVIQDGVKDDVKNLVKSLYDYSKSEEKGSKKQKQSALPELIVQDFDEEQIWQQLELQNSECWDKLVWEVANCMSAKNDLIFPVDIMEESKKQRVDENSDNSLSGSGQSDFDENTETQNKTKKSKNKVTRKKKASDDSLSGSQSDFDEENIAKKPLNKVTKKIQKGSIVDDQFFKLKDMEKFLINEEKKESSKKNDRQADSDEESIDMFEDIDDDDESEDEESKKDMMYTDFFDEQDGAQEDGESFDQNNDLSDEERQPNLNNKNKKVKFAGLSSDDDDSENVSDQEPSKLTNGKTNEKKSDFEHRQERLQQTITRLEEKSLKEAPWQLKGEVNALKRPQNSLLEEVVDFDLTSRPPPLITEQTTFTLEDIIKRRIKDKAWDDVEKKEKPVDDQLSFRKTEIIDQSKSKLSLAQVYEAEYLKQKQALSGEVEEEKEPEVHTEIRAAMNKLFAKLDALCHYHYTPKAPQAEVKIVSNTPAISMEEVAPVATSDAALLAPEEVKRKSKGDPMSKEERTQTDKNRERRKKKKHQRLKGKVTKVTEHRNTKMAAEANDKSLKTSKAFFQQLNDDSTSLIKSKKGKNIVKNKGQ